MIIENKNIKETKLVKIEEEELAMITGGGWGSAASGCFSILGESARYIVNLRNPYLMGLAAIGICAWGAYVGSHLPD